MPLAYMDMIIETITKNESLWLDAYEHSKVLLCILQTIEIAFSSIAL